MITTPISSQDFRNKYEVFYNEMRLYLWPYDLLELLGKIEVEIYTDFIDLDKLRNDFYKLKNQIREVIQDDEELEKATVALENLITEEYEDDSFYYNLPRVAEKNQEKDKVLATPDDDKEEDEEELKGGISDENKQIGIQ